jgi:hypothetical protein
MPGFDATGPRGQGPGRGWGLGPCGAGLRRGGGPGRGRGLALGAGFGAGGFRRGYGSWGIGASRPRPVVAASPQDDVAALRHEANALKAELEAVRKRLAELEGGQP